MATPTNNPSLIKQALGKALYCSMIAIPTLISLTVAYQFKTMEWPTEESSTKAPQVVCIESNICAIEVYGKWYRISGIIAMDQTIPEEYKLNPLIDEPELRPGVNPKAGVDALGSIIDSMVTPSNTE